MKKYMIPAAAIALTAAMTSAAAAEDCGMSTLAMKGNPSEPAMGVSDLQTGDYARGRLKDILDNIVCQSQGLDNRAGNWTELTNDDRVTAQRLKELANISVIAAEFQEVGQTGPVSMQVSSVHHTLYFNPLLSEEENATAGLALLKDTIERGVMGEPTYGACKYVRNQVACSPTIEIK